MRSIRFHGAALAFALVLATGFTVSTLQQPAFSQETTGGLQGTIKDPTGAVVPGARVIVTAPSLVGTKESVSDAGGYYRFANLPPGNYTVSVTAAGFETIKREKINLEVGHLPTLNLTLSVGKVSTVVEVNTEGPLIDTTSTTTLTNIPEEVIKDVPHGTSFQSVIQFAPAARNEPLEGNSSMSNGGGNTSPGNGSNGGAFGFSIAGGADSENSYLVEGQETADLIGGYSHTNVPMDFIQEVQMKTSGVEAEYGGALGGVVNVIMQKGTSAWHGSVFTQFQSGALNGSPVAFSRYDPSSSGCPAGNAGCPTAYTIDPDYQNYQPIRPHTGDNFPGATLGGPLFGFMPHASSNLKDRAFVFLAFNPEFNAFEETENFGPNGGKLPFSQNTQTYYSYARIDAEATKKVRVFGSWLYQLQRQAGEALPPTPDSVQGYYNTTTGCFGKNTTASNCLTAGIPTSAFPHQTGYVAPNLTVNTGADWTISNSVVSTTRFGYFFENYHDLGYPTTGTITEFQDNGVGNTDLNGNLLSVSAPTLSQSTGYYNLPLATNYTHRNASKAIQLDEDIAWFHSGRGGTHNLKFGYQLNRDSNNIYMRFNTPYMQIWPGTTNPYFIQGSVGLANCQLPGITYFTSANDVSPSNPLGISSCQGTYGTVDVYDAGTDGKATSYNNGFFAQDTWTLGKGLTVNVGVRMEHESLPAENQPSTQKLTTPIDFGWGAKVAPRFGAAWDVFKDGKMKVFAGYGEFYDQMKLNVAISSYGGQYWQECWYALNSPTLAGISPAYNSTADGSRYCVGPDSSSQATWPNNVTPSGLTFLENQNLRAFPTTCSTCSVTEEGTAPGLKPYSQHDANFGVDYQLKANIAFEARWDRRRIDNVIEDSAIFNPAVGETFVIVNPGKGINSTFKGFYNFLYGTPADCSSGCPPDKTIPAARSYDGLELRLTKSVSNHWMGMFSYTWSNFRGNYTGLTSSDVADGGGGRNSPNNSRSFDEPFFSWDAAGKSSSGLLPTDRPSALKGYVYYDLPWLKRFTTDFGIFQSAYEGTPLTSYLDVGYAYPGAFPTDIVDRGKWIDVHQDLNTGVITTGTPYTKRTPWFTQSDFNFKQSVRISENKNLAFDATFTNALNQHSVVSDGQQIDSNYVQSFIAPGGNNLLNGPAFYASAMTPYNYTTLMNGAPTGVGGNGPLTVDSQYGKPYLYQQARSIRLGLHFTF
jgi:hypothetical protein